MVTLGVRLIAAALVLLPCAMASLDASGTVRRFQRIRVLRPCHETLIEDGVRQSPTIRALVSRLEASDLIVYVRCTAAKNGAFNGRLAFLGAVADRRYVLIELKIPGRWTAHLTTVGHELQHAVEIANAEWVRSERAMFEYYSRAGITVSRAPAVFDTDAARRIEVDVQRELPTEGGARESAKMRAPRDLWPPD